jgi:chemotaxis protein CheD
MITKDDIGSGIGTHHLLQSTLFVSKEPIEIQTLLGSCVAVCLYDPVTKSGGMNHFMNPLWNGQGLESPRFGNIAIDLLVGKMIRLGVNREKMIAKVFGGASQFKSSSMNVGEMNVQVAYQMLQKHQIQVRSASTGGTQGKKISFNTWTGEVLMRSFVQ